MYIRYMILIMVSYTGDYEHPYYSYAEDEQYANEELYEEEVPQQDV